MLLFFSVQTTKKTSERMPSEHCARMTRNTIANKSCMTNNLRWLLKSLCVQGANNKEARLQTDHNTAAEFMGRICKSHRVITSQISGVKPQWENTAATSLFVPPSKPHESISVFQSWELLIKKASESHSGKKKSGKQRKKERNKQKTQNRTLFVGVVTRKNILCTQPLSPSVTAVDTSTALSTSRTTDDLMKWFKTETPRQACASERAHLLKRECNCASWVWRCCHVWHANFQQLIKLKVKCLQDLNELITPHMLRIKFLF